MKKIKVGIVNYLNTRPLLYGIQRSAVMERIELSGDYPAKVARALIAREIDLGLVPVAIIPKLKEHHIIGDYCIGCDGEVASVCLYSDVPIAGVKKVLLDYQSRTSVELAKILLESYWKSKAQIIPADEDFRSKIVGDTAGLVIGDRSFEQRLVSRYVYDLGAAWKDYTGLPFVFAAWVSNRVLDEEFVQAFNEANAFGVNNIDAAIQDIRYDKFNLNKYFHDHIKYYLDAEKRKGLQLFLKMLEERQVAGITN